MPDRTIPALDEAVRRQLAKILGSGVFAGSRRMARFLKFAVEETLNGNAHELKEIVIGAKVFDRKASYDPRLDPIVRVEARRLRAKLQSYYGGKGQHDDLLIEFPKGRYSPVFQTRSERRLESNAADPQREATIAVLPFTNLDPEDGGEYFSDGLSEELIHALMRIAELRVVAWHSAAQLRDRPEDMGAIRERLKVAHVLHGSIRRTGDRLRIAAHLIDTANGQYVWSETYNRRVHDVFAIQEEIAGAIAVALDLQFWKRNVDPKGQTPASLECFQLCLQGRFHARDRTVEGLKRSLVFFEEAVSLNNTSAAAYTGLADTCALLADYGFAEGCEYMSKAKTAVEQALILDPFFAEAHASMGLILTLYDWWWEQAGKEFERALELNPGYASAHHWYSLDYLAMLGRFEEAHTEIEAAIQIDPLSSLLLVGRAHLRMLARDYDDSIRCSKAVIEMDPSFYKGYTELGRAYLQSQRYGDAIQMLERGRSLVGDIASILGALGQAHGLAGQASEARQLLDNLHRIAEVRHVPCTCFALIHLGLDEKEAALQWVERGVARHQSPVVALNVHPAYDALRQEARFQALLRSIGFPG